MAPPPPRSNDPDSEHELTPEEEQAWAAGMERVAEERRRALKEPGPTWREWFFYDHARWWVGLAFLIVDSWIALGFVSNGAITGTGVVLTVVLLAVAIYLEILLYRYLWRRPKEARHGRFRPSWTGLTAVGRWTPEGAQARKGLPSTVTDDGGPNAKDFL